MKLIDGAEVWRLHATHGFPLECSIPLLADRGCLPTWMTLIDAAVADGMDRARIIRRLYDLVGDAYSPTETSAIRRRLALL